MRRVGVIALAGATLAVCLSGCTADGSPAASPTQTAWTATPVPGSAGGTAGPIATGTAAQNKPAFDRVVSRVLGTNRKATGEAVAAALAAAGFPKSTLQFSASMTSAHLEPGSIVVSAQLGSSCLIGQWGSAVGGYHSVVAPALGSGGCLVGGGGTGTTPPTSAAELGN